MHIHIISGSARQDNNTLRVAKAMQALLEKDHVLHITDFSDYDIPFQAQGGLNPEQLSSFQKILIDKTSEAHVIIIISPEYNWSITPELLNAIHLLADPPFGKIFDNKILAFAGVSTGKGGKTPALHLMQLFNKVISYGLYESVVSAKIFESHYTKDMLDEGGNFLPGSDAYKKNMQHFLDYTLKIADRWFASS